jgi:fibronectin type 3 domain-containing protein
MPEVVQPSSPARSLIKSRSPWRLWLFVLMTCALMLPVAVGTLASDDVELVGEVILEHADYFEQGRAEEYKVLQTDRGVFRLEGPGAERARENTVVRVRGKRQGDTVVLAASGSVTTLAESSESTTSDGVTAASAGTRRVAILLINFVDPPPPETPEPTPDPDHSPDPDASPTPSPSPSPTPTAKEPWTKSFVRGVYFNNTRSVKNFYYEVSNGAVTLTGDAFGYYTIAAATNKCEYADWGATARKMASADGVNLNSYDYVVHAWERVSACPWGGLAQINNRYNWINGAMTPYVTIHELGHNFGAHHASTMTCTSGGQRVPLSNNCTVNEYGDPHDVMGQNASGPSKQRHFHAWHRRQVGFLGSGEQVTVTANGYYTIAPAPVPGIPRSVRIPRPAAGDYYYLEFRQPYGTFDDYATDAHAVNSVMVRIAPGSKRVQSKLLDMNPSTSGFGDAGLGVGQTFTDKTNDVTLKTMSVGKSGAVVRITVGPDTVPPTTPGNLKASTHTDTSIRLTWTASTDDLELTGYRIRRDGVTVATVNANTLAWTHTGAIQGVTYNYSVVALDWAGNSSAPATVSHQLPDTIPPEGPFNVTAAQTGPRQVTVNWEPATDNGVVAFYRVRRNGSLYATTTATSYVDSNAIDGFSYSYEVRAEDAAGNRGSIIKATPSTISLPDVTPPTAPGSLSSASSGGGTSLSWTAATDNVAVTGYRVARDDVHVATLGASARSFSESALAAGTYLYTVIAFDAAGNVGPALGATVTVAAESSTPSTPQNLAGEALDKRYVQLTWDASSGGSGGITYRIFRNDTRIATGVTKTGYLDRAPSVGTYTYKVRAVDSAGNKSSFTPKITVKAVKSTSTVSATPSTPQNLAGKALDKRYVQLTWDASSGGSGGITYRIFRNDTRIATGVTKTGYLDRAPSVGTYTYKVRAVDSAGNKSSFTPKITVKAVKVAQ